MSIAHSLFKQTFIYGLAAVLPRILTFLLNPIYVDYLPNSAAMGEVAIIFSNLVFFNVLLSYGMETSFFRYYTIESHKNKVVSTSLYSILVTSLLFFGLCLLFKNSLAEILSIEKEYIVYTIWIFTLDALVVIPFAKMRALKKSGQYAFLKIFNVVVNVILTLFFLVFLPKWAAASSFWQTFYIPNFEIGYIFIANLAASLVTFILVLQDYFKTPFLFDRELYKKMLRYAFPVLIAGIAFAINEHFDKILLEKFHVSKADIGAYAACYKIGLFMVLFRTAFTLGVEPFFFSLATQENAPKTYAIVTKYFVIFGSFICLLVIVFSDIIKAFLVPNETYWYAMTIVPIIVFANFFLGIYTNLSVWYKLINKTSIGAYISLIGATLTLLINFLFIPKYGFMASAIATLSAYGLMMIISFTLGQKKYPIPYETTKIIAYISFSLLLSCLCFYVPFVEENFFIKTTALLLFVFFVYNNEKEEIKKIIMIKKWT